VNALYLELVERIRGEVPDLDRVVQRALAAWVQAKRMPDESAYLDSVALNLHGFYSGLERLFELIQNCGLRYALSCWPLLTFWKHWVGRMIVEKQVQATREVT